MDKLRHTPREDPRDIPAYSISEAAHYLGIPGATLRAWMRGQRDRRTGRWRFRPVLRLPDQRSPHLSFVNLAEAHVLDGLRRQQRIPMQKIRAALDYLRRELPVAHPLVDHRFVTDGLELFVEHCEQLVNLSKRGQLELRQILEAYLTRLERDAHGQVARLYLFTRLRSADEPRVVVVDPRVSFGRPVLAGTGIPTAVIAERYKAGESIEDLMSDYRLPRMQVEEAIRVELEAA